MTEKKEKSHKESYLFHTRANAMNAHAATHAMTMLLTAPALIALFEEEVLDVCEACTSCMSTDVTHSVNGPASSVARHWITCSPMPMLLPSMSAAQASLGLHHPTQRSD